MYSSLKNLALVITLLMSIALCHNSALAQDATPKATETKPAATGLCADLSKKFNTQWHTWRSHSTMIKTLDYLNSKYPGSILSPSTTTIQKWLTQDKAKASSSSPNKSLYVTCHNRSKQSVTLSIHSSVTKKNYPVVLKTTDLLK